MKDHKSTKSSRPAIARRIVPLAKLCAAEPADVMVAPPLPPPVLPAAVPAAVGADSQEFPPGWQRLTPTQKRVFQLIAAGRTTNAIAAELGASPHTVQAHRVHLSVRLGLRGRRALQQVALAHQGLAV